MPSFVVNLRLVTLDILLCAVLPQSVSQSLFLDILRISDCERRRQVVASDKKGRSWRNTWVGATTLPIEAHDIVSRGHSADSLRVSTGGGSGVRFEVEPYFSAHPSASKLGAAGDGSGVRFVVRRKKMEMFFGRV